MKAIVQRVGWAEVEVDGCVVGRIEEGLLVYVGVGAGEGLAAAEMLARRIANMRILDDDSGKLNLSVRDARGGVLAVPNFTLMADTRKGRRPAFVGAASSAAAEPVFEAFIAELAKSGCQVAGGVFGANMIIRSAADGPVNIIVQTPGLGE